MAGVEYGDLFGYVVGGKYPPEELPNPRSWEDDFEIACKEIEDSVLILQAFSYSSFAGYFRQDCRIANQRKYVK